MAASLLTSVEISRVSEEAGASKTATSWPKASRPLPGVHGSAGKLLELQARGSGDHVGVGEKEGSAIESRNKSAARAFTGRDDEERILHLMRRGGGRCLGNRVLSQRPGKKNKTRGNAPKCPHKRIGSYHRMPTRANGKEREGRRDRFRMASRMCLFSATRRQIRPASGARSRP